MSEYTGQQPHSYSESSGHLARSSVGVYGPESRNHLVYAPEAYVVPLLVLRSSSWYVYIWSRVPCSHPPPWDGGGMMPLWWCIYIHTYIPTYLPTYLRTYIHTITLPYLTLPYLTLHYLTLHSIHTYHYLTLPYITLPYLTLHSIHIYIHTYTDTHTYIHTQTHTHTYIHTYQHTYQHTNIPAYQHTNIPPPQATGGGTRRTIPPPQATGGGTRRTIPPPQATGGGDQKNQTILSTHTHWWGGEGGWPTLHHIYI